MNIGLFGGTFDPVHKAHIGIAEIFLGKFSLEKCIFIPCNVSPFKDNDNQKQTPNVDRLAMLEIATSHETRFEISDIELNRGGISYTIDTVKQFAEIYSGDNLFLLIGRDQASEFVRWKDFELIAELATIVIANRPDIDCTQSLPELMDRLGENGINPKFLNNEEMPDSSTAIRFRLHRNFPTSNSIDSKVMNYIQKKGLYR
jgi:nicotinate-nucleotide adenylyltransferase